VLHAAFNKGTKVGDIKWKSGKVLLSCGILEESKGRLMKKITKGGLYIN